MKSAPAAIASNEACLISTAERNAPLSKMTFKCALPQAAFNSCSSSYTSLWNPLKNLPIEITTSISSAPACTVKAVSATFTSINDCEDGKQAATAAMFTPFSFSNTALVTGTKDG